MAGIRSLNPHASKRARVPSKGGMFNKNSREAALHDLSSFDIVQLKARKVVSIAGVGPDRPPNDPPFYIPSG